LILRVADAAKLDLEGLRRLGARAVAPSGAGRVHLLLDEPTAEAVAAALQPA
jgi:hypothetical protein